MASSGNGNQTVCNDDGYGELIWTTAWTNIGRPSSLSTTNHFLAYFTNERDSEKL